MVFSYIARLVAFFTGRTISASAGAAKAMNGVGSAAGSAAKKVKDANGELAAFDELNVLNKQSDDSSGGAVVEQTALPRTSTFLRRSIP